MRTHYMLYLMLGFMAAVACNKGGKTNPDAGTTTDTDAGPFWYHRACMCRLV